MTGEISKQTLAVLVAVVLVLSVVGTWMVMTSNTGDVNVVQDQETAKGQVTLSLENGAPVPSEDNTATGYVVFSFE